MRTSSQVAVNALTGWFSFALNAAIGIALVPFLIEMLGKRGYGLTTLAGTILVFCLLADMGLTHALSRQLAEAIARKQTRLCNEYVSSAMAVYLLLALVISTVLVLCEGPILEALKVPAEFIPEGQFLVRFYAPSMVFLTFYSCTSQSVLTSHKRYDAINLSSAAARLTRGIAMFLIIWLLWPNLYGWAAGMLLGQLLRALLLSWRAHAIHAGFQVRLGYISKQALASILSVGGALFVIRVTGTMAIQSDPIILSFFLGPAALALYGPATTVFMQVRPLVLMISNQIHPLVTVAYVDEDKKRIQQVLIRGTKYTVMIGVFISSFLAVFAFPLCRIWLEKALGSQYRTTAWIMMGLAASDLLLYAAGTHWPVLLGLKKLNILMWAQVVAAIGGIAMAVLLVGFSPVGIYGVVFAAIAFGFIRRAWVYLHVCKVCQISPLQYFKVAYLGPVCVLLLSLAANLLILQLLQPRSLVILAAAAALSALAWAGACWAIGFSAQDRKSFVQLTTGAIRRIRRN